MNKNPFSIYDFLGYLFPGAFVLTLLYYFHVNKVENFSNLSDYYAGIVICLRKIRSLDLSASQLSILFTVEVIVAYIFGHLIGYLSSITVENLTIWFFGYPSEYLLENTNKCMFLRDIKAIYKKKDNLWQLKITTKIIVKIFVLFGLLPITIALGFLRILRMDDFFIKKLDNFLVDAINKKKVSLSNELNIPNPTEYGHVDYHRVIYHYVYENLPNHQKKLDNYVALYDFLRSLTLIFNIVFLIVIYQTISSGFCNIVSRGWILILLLTLVFITYMGFAKFYRRYTLEVFMALVTDKNLKK